MFLSHHWIISFFDLHFRSFDKRCFYCLSFKFQSHFISHLLLAIFYWKARLNRCSSFLKRNNSCWLTKSGLNLKKKDLFGRLDAYKNLLLWSNNPFYYLIKNKRLLIQRNGYGTSTTFKLKDIFTVASFQRLIVVAGHYSEKSSSINYWIFNFLFDNFVDANLSTGWWGSY